MSELEPTRTYSNPTANDILRRMLDERGVEWKAPASYDGSTKYDTIVDGYWFHEYDGKITVHGLTPEQAIAATMGDADATGERQRDAVEVVRCRDCKFYTPESMTREERGFGVYENVWEPGGCFNPERCSATWDSIAGQMVPVGIVTEPDGFCAWGVRKESE